MDDEGRVVC